MIAQQSATGVGGLTEEGRHVEGKRGDRRVGEERKKGCWDILEGG